MRLLLFAAMAALAATDGATPQSLEYRIERLAREQAALPAPKPGDTPEQEREVLKRRHKAEVPIVLEMTVAARRLQVYRQTARLPDASEVADAAELRRFLDDAWSQKAGGGADQGCEVLEHCRQAPALELSLPALIEQIDRYSAAQAPLVAKKAPVQKAAAPAFVVAARSLPAPAVRPAAPVAKSEPPKKDSVPGLVAMLASPDARRRALAADALGAFGSDAAPAVEALRRALSDRDARVRASAAMALGDIAIATPAVLQDLERSLQDPSEDVRLSSRAALGLLASRR